MFEQLKEHIDVIRDFAERLMEQMAPLDLIPMASFIVSCACTAYPVPFLSVMLADLFVYQCTIL